MLSYSQMESIKILSKGFQGEKINIVQFVPRNSHRGTWKFNKKKLKT